MTILSKKELKLMDEYFRVLNYLSVAQLYLLENPLLLCKGLIFCFCSIKNQHKRTCKRLCSFYSFNWAFL